MLEVYGQLIRAQLQISATDLTPTATGLIYFNTTTGVKWYNGSVWKTAVDLDTAQNLTNKNLGSATNVLTGATAGSFTNTGTITLPTVTGILALVADITTTALTMSNKTLVQPLIDNYFDINEESVPGTPPANTVRVYAKADGKLYKKDDTGVESEVGSGAGSSLKNYLQDWYDGTKVVAVSATTLGATANRTTDQGLWARSTVAGLTIENNAVTPLRPLGDFLVNSSASTIASFVESPLFTIDSADLTKPLSIEFDLTGIAASTSYDVVVVRYNSSGTYQETIPVAGNASTGTPSSAQLPTGTTKFSGFFIPSSTSTDLYGLRLRKVAAVDDDFQIDSLFIGSKSLAEGAVVTAWQSYTPTLSNLTGTITGRYRRIGDSLEVYAQASATGASSNIIRISIPTGLTIDLNKTPNPARVVCGVAKALRNGVGIYEGAVETTGSTEVLVYLTDNASQAAGSTTPWAWQNGDSLDVHFTVPVTQWSGTTTLADRALEEYAWNSSATTTNDTTSFANGPEGVNIRAFAPVGNNVVQKRVRFQTPILPTDRISIEFNPGSGWALASDILGATTTNDAGTASYGQYIRPVIGSNTDFDVFFNSAATGLSAWSGLTGYKWRVRKVSSGASVGYPISARNIVGDTSGTVVPNGMIGEYKQQTWSGVTPPNNTAYFNPASVVLTPGIWELSVQSGGGAANSFGISGGISTDSGTTFSDLVDGFNFNFGHTTVTGVNNTAFVVTPFIVNITSTTTYYAKVKVGGTISGTNAGKILATRKA
jgi:hypothetical protein